MRVLAPATAPEREHLERGPTVFPVVAPAQVVYRNTASSPARLPTAAIAIDGPTSSRNDGTLSAPPSHPRPGSRYLPSQHRSADHARRFRAELGGTSAPVCRARPPMPPLNAARNVPYNTSVELRRARPTPPRTRDRRWLTSALGQRDGLGYPRPSRSRRDHRLPRTPTRACTATSAVFAPPGASHRLQRASAAAPPGESPSGGARGDSLPMTRAAPATSARRIHPEVADLAANPCAPRARAA